ncbi:MAG TPA: class I SAM-dependent methyltransferase [Hyphomonadaceae bacterium]|nr:class I SAM-dependent methyltransferase [Hyphomonadaceae bacterium]
MKTAFLKVAGASLAVIALVAACDQSKPADTAATAPAPAAPATPPPAPAAPAPDYAALLKAADRPAADAEKDAARKPAEVLAFSKIMPGETVFEMEAGAGWYTELLSHAVGPNGHVTMQSPDFGTFYKKDVDARLKDNRLANVKVSTSNFDKLDAGDGTVDVVTWFQGPHEMWCMKDCGGKSLGDPAKSFAEISRILKPGGYLVIMDHAAKQGEPTSTGDKLHRIDKMQVMALATGANFALDEESSLLAQPADDHTKNIFEKDIRGKTDQFLLRYKKP